MDQTQPAESHLIAHARIHLVRKKEGGYISLRGRILQPANYNHDSINSWSTWFIIEQRLRFGEERQVPIAVAFDDTAPMGELFRVGNEFISFIDGRTYIEGVIVCVETVTDEEFNKLFHFNEWGTYFSFVFPEETDV